MRELTTQEQEIVTQNEASGFKYKSQHTSTKSLPYRRLPGHVLVEEFLVPNYPADLRHLAHRTGIPLRRLHLLIRGQDRISKDMAERLARHYRNEVSYWLELQKRYDRGEKL